jgi:hypothetical protein
MNWKSLAKTYIFENTAVSRYPTARGYEKKRDEK